MHVIEQCFVFTKAEVYTHSHTHSHKYIYAGSLRLITDNSIKFKHIYIQYMRIFIIQKIKTPTHTHARTHALSESERETVQ